MDEVEYRDIAGFPGYRVGSDGSVWSSRIKGWRQLRPRNNGARRRLRKGYYQSVMLNRDRKPHNRLIHVLILESFVGPRPCGGECRHLDGDPTNNALSNLCWGTRGENIDDMRAHGSFVVGSARPLAKLNEEEAAAVRCLYRRGVTVSHMAMIFCVSGTTIHQVLTGRCWSHAK